ncbi:MAG: tetratricopeptide repeat protein [Acidobacteria bacterium]|nr:tetratricopeptide repeat protein [Acidobacteriota bacterium]
MLAWHLYFRRVMTVAGLALFLAAAPVGAPESPSVALDRARRELNELEKQHGLFHPAVRQQIETVVLQLVKQQNLSAAESLLVEALRRREGAPAATISYLTPYYLSLAAIYGNQGKFTAAEKVFGKMEKKIQAAHGKKSREMADCYYRMSLYFRIKGDWKKAEKYGKKCLDIQKNVSPPADLDRALAMNNLGLIKTYRRDYDDAVDWFQQAIVHMRRNGLDEQPDFPIIVMNMGAAYQRDGKMADAESTFAMAVTLLEQRDAAGGQLAGALLKLAEVQEEQRNIAAAMATYAQALAIQENEAGRNAPVLIDPISRLADLSVAAEEYVQAAELYRRLVALYDTQPDPKPVNLAMALNNLGECLYQLRQYHAAAPVFQRAIELLEKNVPQDNAQLSLPLNNLALVCQKQQDYEQAEGLLQRVLVVDSAARGRRHPVVAITLNNLGLLAEDQEKFKEAEEYYRRALAIQEEALGPDHPETGLTVLNLGLLFQRQERPAAAGEYLERAVNILVDALGPDNPDTIAAIRRLIAFYQAQNRPRDAERLEEFLRENSVPDDTSSRP